MYDLLKKMHDVGGKQYWPCDSCSASMSKVNTRLVSLEKKMDNVEEEILKQKDDISTNTESITCIRKDIEDMRANVNKDNSSTDSILRELKEREAIADNIIVHNMEEPADSVRMGADRKRMDQENFSKVMSLLDVDLDWKHDVVFSARLGDKQDDTEKNRPLKIKFKNNDKKQEILEKARELAGTNYDHIQLVPDLTRRQRLDDADCRKKCDELNEKLSEDDFLVWEWRPVGKRGSQLPAKLKKRPERTQPNRGRGRGKRRRTPSGDRRSSRTRHN